MWKELNDEENASYCSWFLVICFRVLTSPHKFYRSVVVNVPDIYYFNVPVDNFFLLSSPRINSLTSPHTLAVELWRRGFYKNLLNEVGFKYLPDITSEFE
jgi:hypothetical protein